MFGDTLQNSIQVDMHACAQGVRDFLRAYFHYKNADWSDNRPYPLAAWSAEELAKMPTYYIMNLDQNMAETVAPYMPGRSQIGRCNWLTEEELLAYSGAFAKTGFQGGLNWYRCATSEICQRELILFGDQRIDVPACFIAGSSDWGVPEARRLRKAQDWCLFAGAWSSFD